jgi:hypothetical protein
VARPFHGVGAGQVRLGSTTPAIVGSVAGSGSLGRPADPASDSPLILVHESAHLGVQRVGLSGAGGRVGVEPLGGTPRGEQFRGRRRHLLTPRAITAIVIAAAPG